MRIKAIFAIGLAVAVSVMSFVVTNYGIVEAGGRWSGID